MIKFFRKIRQQLAYENNLTKYMRYAIGEIVLVVIGILIALSLNNWNEGRKGRIYEKKALKEISAALKTDSTVNRRIQERVQRRDTAINNILSYLKSGATNADSMLIENLIDSNTGIKISFNGGAYEALKSKGLEYIRNDSLRNMIVAAYEFWLPRNEFFGDEGRKDYIYHKRDQLHKKVTDLYIESDGEKNMIKESIILNSNEKREALMRLMKLQMELSEFYRYLLLQQSRKINQVQTQIRLELEKFNH